MNENLNENLTEFVNDQKKKTIKKLRRNNSYVEMFIVSLVVLVLFGLMIRHFINFINAESPDFIYNTYNSRFGTYSEKVIRGDIKTNDGVVIATTVEEDGEQARNYPFDEMFSHVVGYVKEGMAGLEKTYTYDLIKTHVPYSEIVDNDLNGKKTQGDSLITTLDFETQKVAYEEMGYYKGAVVAIDPDTGKVVCMVSKPDFDPNIIETYWDFITNEEVESSILLNRAVAGLYPPGSTFKIVTTLAYERANPDYENFSYNCKGQLSLNDYIIHCSSNKNHGSLDLEHAFAKSCNSTFAYLATQVDSKDFNNTVNELMFNEKLPTMLEGVKKSRCEIKAEDDLPLVGQTGIGQGNTGVTPLHMCMLVAAIANDGVVMEPYIVDHFESENGDVINATEPVKYGSIMTKEESSLLSTYMKAVTESGTAASVDFYGLDSYGKTGTAEFSDSKDAGYHSWYVGYAVNSSGKKLAVAVIMEGAGYGSQYAAPLAAKVMDAYLN